jgi:hypothetical protein
MDAVRAAGVDMNDPQVIRTVMRRFDETLTALEPLAEQGRQRRVEAQPQPVAPQQ